jgi:hypothetical protein
MTTATDHDEKLSDLTTLGAREGNDRHYFGQITIVDDWDAAWPKGSKPVPFDPGQHAPEQRRVYIQLKVTCTKADGTTYDLDQGEVTSGSKHRVTLKSLEALGVVSRSQLRALAGRHCEVVRAPTGQKYTARQGDRAGQQVDEVALKFLALFDDESACKAAETAFYTPRSGGVTDKNAPQPLTPAEGGAQLDQAARAQLLATLEPIWNAAGKDYTKFTDILAKNRQYEANGITTTSPEVIALTGQVPF